MTAAYFLWFGVAWVFLIAVLLKHWRSRERADKEATEKMLASTRHDTSGEHIYDA